jgi:hypothetical protein
MTEIKYLVDGHIGNYQKTSIIIDMEQGRKYDDTKIKRVLSD